MPEAAESSQERAGQNQGSAVIHTTTFEVPCHIFNKSWIGRRWKTPFLTLDWINMKLGNSAMALEQKEGWIMLLKNG